LQQQILAAEKSKDFKLLAALHLRKTELKLQIAQ
jgi:hypothetical protein